MEWLPFVLAGGLAVCLIALAIAHTKMRGFRDRVSRMSAALDADLAQVREELSLERKKASEVQEKVAGWIAEKTEASTRLSDAEARALSLMKERDEAAGKRDEAVKAQTEAEKQAALRLQELQGMKQRMEDWEKARLESLQAAKAATLEVGAQLSSKLLADHKRETDAAKKDSEERTKKATEILTRQFDEIVKSVAALDKSVDENKGTMDTVWNALSNPGGAGYFAEIGLNNSLKSFGLEINRDYVIQESIEGKKLRPDAMIFLPGNTVLVVDSKASKHLLELADAEGTDEEEAAYKKLSKTMNQHLRDLANKNYKEETLAGYREAGRHDEIRRIMSVMYLPNEGAVEKLSRADPGFIQKAAKAQITIAGPSALACLVGFARVEIDLGRQAENQEKIVQGTQALLDSIGTLVELTVGVGRGLKTAAKNYKDLARSMNARLLPRVRMVESLGVRPARTKGIQKSIPAFEIVELELGGLIEGEAEEIHDPPALLGDSAGKDDV